MEQMTLWDMTRKPFKIDKRIRLIELFAGYGSQAMALERLGADFEHYRAIEFDKYAMASYNAVHGTDFEPTDIKDIKGIDLGIVDKERFTYLLTYLFISMYRFKPCRKAGRNGQRKWYKVRPFVGSRAAIK